MTSSIQLKANEPNVKYQTITFAAGVTPIIDTKGCTLVGFSQAAGAAAAAVTFSVCNTDTGTFVPLYTNDAVGAEAPVTFTVSTTTARAYSFGQDISLKLDPWRYIKINNAASAATIMVAMRSIA